MIKILPRDRVDVVEVATFHKIIQDLERRVSDLEKRLAFKSVVAHAEDD